MLSRVFSSIRRIPATTPPNKQFSTGFAHPNSQNIEDNLPAMNTPGKLEQLTEKEQQAKYLKKYFKDTTGPNGEQHPVFLKKGANGFTIVGSATHSSFVNGKPTINLPTLISQSQKNLNNTKIVPVNDLADSPNIDAGFFSSNKTIASTNSKGDQEFDKSIGYVPPKKEYKVDTPKDDDR